LSLKKELLSKPLKEKQHD